MYISLFYDVIIMGFLLLTGAGIIFLVFFKSARSRFWVRHKKLFAAALSALGLIWFVVFYGSFIEPRLIVLANYEFNSKKVSRPMRIAVVSDTHAGPAKGKRFIKRLANKIERAKPDAVFLLGDLISDDESNIPLLEPLLALSANTPTFAILGNHDYLGVPNQGQVVKSFSPLEPYLRRYGVTALKNENTQIELNGNKLAIAGIDDLASGAPDMRAALMGMPPEALRVLLSHSPDAVLYLKPGEVDMVMSGHTHGGQIRLPFIGPIAPEPTVLGRKFTRGFYVINNITLFITSGAGESGPRARLFVPPEIAIFEIK
ncbi:metallophosphoesterase [Candidatus Uhrbacteria bacterium]|nr:metallophosphoesterase [Candidatus Uhrbacteria bacterium]